MSHAIVPPTAHFTLDYDFGGRTAIVGTLAYPSAMLDAVLAEEVAWWQDFTSGDVLSVFEGETGITLILSHGYISINVVEHFSIERV